MNAETQKNNRARHLGREFSIGVVGLGYVGLPLAVSLSKHFEVIGYDISDFRIRDLSHGIDETGEVDSASLARSEILFTSEHHKLATCNFYVVTVPTPIDAYKKPDLSALEQASRTVGQYLSEGDIVVFESTVYPGVTEDFCGQILTERSNLSVQIRSDDVPRSFHLGYSPERINPGDKSKSLESIIKVVAASNDQGLELISSVYSSIIEAGLYKAPSIKVAESAKVIENIQRDVNIALLNELAVLFNELDIDTEEVLKAAGTKWNFLNFRPGLVGGHCIGVDPYYLTHKAAEVGFHPEMILAGRRTNDSMSAFVVQRFVSLLGQQEISIFKSRILVLGLTFKENCPDTRNSKVFDLIQGLTKLGATVEVFDPLIKSKRYQSVSLINNFDALPKGVYDGVLLAVPHDEILAMGYSHA